MKKILKLLKNLWEILGKSGSWLGSGSARDLPSSARLENFWLEKSSARIWLEKFWLGSARLETENLGSVPPLPQTRDHYTAQPYKQTCREGSKTGIQFSFTKKSTIVSTLTIEFACCRIEAIMRPNFIYILPKNAKN